MKQSDKFKKKWITLAIAPDVLSLLFIVNFVFSASLGEETYHYSYTTQRGNRGGTRVTSMIRLDEDQYDEYMGMRIFGSIEQFENGRFITYEMSQGVLGYKVVSHYRFHTKPEGWSKN